MDTKTTTKLSATWPCLPFFHVFFSTVGWCLCYFSLFHLYLYCSSCSFLVPASEHKTTATILRGGWEFPLGPNSSNSPARPGMKPTSPQLRLPQAWFLPTVNQLFHRLCRSRTPPPPHKKKKDSPPRSFCQCVKERNQLLARCLPWQPLLYRHSLASRLRAPSSTSQHVELPEPSSGNEGRETTARRLSSSSPSDQRTTQKKH